jgi:putative ABC transport system permease protein
MRTFENLARDTRLAIRGLSRSPLFTLVAVLTLAVGSGAMAAVFGVLDGVLIKPLPYPEPDRLISIWHDAPGAPGLATASGSLRPSPSMYVTYQEQNESFEQIGIWTTGTVGVTGVGEPEQLTMLAVTGAVLPALAIAPELGRWLDDTDEATSGAATVMLSHRYWQSRFGGEPDVIGRSITVDGVPREIVGVMPRGFRVLDTGGDLILPIQIPRTGLIPPPFCCEGIARLKPGVDIAEANADIARMLPIWIDQWPFADGRVGTFYLDTWQIAPALRPLKADVVGNVGNTLWIVAGTIGLLLIIACANVTNLILVRSEVRRSESAVRSALGASTWQVARVQWIESALLSAGGGLAGLALSTFLLETIKRMAPATLPRVEDIGLDWRLLAFSFVVCVLIGLVLGAIPSLRYRGSDVVSGLRSGGRAGTARKAELHTLDMLVIGQVALALVLLVGSALMIRTFVALGTVEPGFTEPETLQTARLTIPSSIEPDGAAVATLQERILEAVEAIPGVESAGLISSMPMEGAFNDWDSIVIDGIAQTDDDGPAPLRTFKTVSPDIFGTAGTRIVAGRELEWADIHERRPVALVSENLAREIWGDPRAAIGARISGDGNEFLEIVGVVQDTRDAGLQEPAPSIVYWPLIMSRFRGGSDVVGRNLTLVARSGMAGTQVLDRQIQEAVWTVNGSLPLSSVTTMRNLYDRSRARTTFTIVTLGLAAGAALVLSIVGLYGVIAYAVSRRRREIATRLALGAQRLDITFAFARHGASLAAAGVVIGVVAALLLTRLASTLVYGVSTRDLGTYAAVAVLLVAAAVFASWLPARRAARINPAEALVSDSQ